MINSKGLSELILLHDITGKDNDDLLDGANRIQDMTLESLARTRLMIASSNEVGTSTVEGTIQFFIQNLLHETC